MYCRCHSAGIIALKCLTCSLTCRDFFQNASCSCSIHKFGWPYFGVLNTIGVLCSHTGLLQEDVTALVVPLLQLLLLVPFSGASGDGFRSYCLCSGQPAGHGNRGAIATGGCHLRGGHGSGQLGVGGVVAAGAPFSVIILK